MIRRILLGLVVVTAVTLGTASEAEARGCHYQSSGHYGGHHGGHYRSHRSAYYYGGPSYYHHGHRSNYYGHRSYYGHNHYRGSGVSLSIGF